MKEDVKALKEMMKIVMDQQKEMLEAQKGVAQPMATVSESVSKCKHNKRKEGGSIANKKSIIFGALFVLLILFFLVPLVVMVGGLVYEAFWKHLF